MQADQLPQRRDLWVVAFVPQPEVTDTAWWQAFLHPGYRHCFAFRALSPDLTELVNHSGRALSFAVMTEAADVLASRFARAGMKLLSIPAPAPGHGAMLRGPMTCVEVIKALLGWRGLFILTPRQLERALRRHGARHVVIPPTMQEAT